MRSKCGETSWNFLTVIEVICKSICIRYHHTCNEGARVVVVYLMGATITIELHTFLSIHTQDSRKGSGMHYRCRLRWLLYDRLTIS